jgi:two-component system, cell cycle sensor histidine kinase and response regulator CckA
MSALPQPKVQPSTTDSEGRAVSEAHRMETIGRLISGVAHDFNNLLTGIVLCSELLIAGLANSDKLRHYAEEIRNASAQGADMVQHLLALARQRSGETSSISLNHVIEGMQRLLRRLIGENLELMLELSPELPPLQMDPSEAQEIVLNLVLNARDAMPDGGRISIITRNSPAQERVGSDSLCVELVVADTGAGMDANTRARAFEPFFTTKAEGRGTGLGLATVRRIVTEQNGTIDIETETGEGTRMIIRLPASEPEHQSQTHTRRKGI